jgi:hypothetical protein
VAQPHSERSMGIAMMYITSCCLRSVNNTIQNEIGLMIGQLTWVPLPVAGRDGDADYGSCVLSQPTQLVKCTHNVEGRDRFRRPTKPEKKNLGQQCKLLDHR